MNQQYPAYDVTAYYFSDRAIGQKAYEYWEADGRRDGDEVIDTIMGRMKRRDYHWHKAVETQTLAARTHLSQIIETQFSE